VKAVAWLRDNYPDTSYALINHPSRNNGKYTRPTIANSTTAPKMVFAVEGMVGNQMEPDRGGYTTAYVDANLKNRVYGGVDYVVAQVGGIWDAAGRRPPLLERGRFRPPLQDHRYQQQRLLPGEYAKTYVWIDNKNTGIKGVLEGVRSGKMFSVFGDLINALDFNIASGASKARWAASSRPRLARR
jgi:hypothetical protein